METMVVIWSYMRVFYINKIWTYHLIGLNEYQWIGFKEHLRETHGFLPSKIGLSDSNFPVHQSCERLFHAQPGPEPLRCQLPMAMPLQNKRCLCRRSVQEISRKEPLDPWEKVTSGSLTVCYWKWPIEIVTIYQLNMEIFHSYVM